MKSTAPNTALLSAAVLAIAGYAGVASAHTYSGNLGDAVGATDVHQITCSDDGSGAPAKLVTQILDAAPVNAPTVSVQTAKLGANLTNGTDPTDGDATYSPQTTVTGGAGVYYAIVDKTAVGTENYTLQYHCMTSGNIHTGTALITIQNQ